MEFIIFTMEANKVDPNLQVKVTTMKYYFGFYLI